MFALPIFLSALLLFEVQPLIGKYILPWFGGGPAVWSACLLFFQLTLVAGYGYAHALMSRPKVQSQSIIHIALLVMAAITLPIIPTTRWKPPDPSFPVLRILALLAATLGLPLFALSATAPLLQGWFAQTRPGRSPYRLYALSNAGSLLALISYPFLVEPALSRRQQCIAWSVAFGVFAIFAALCALTASRTAPWAGFDAESETDLRRSRVAPFMWFALSAAGSVILLGTTNSLTLDVAPVPLLWVLPLAVYLLTFVICFDHPRWYRRDVFGVALPAAAVAMIWLMLRPPGQVPVKLQILAYCAILFACCMVCHGELVRLRPGPRHLTRFYLVIAAGGAMGGVFVALIAPRIFTDFAELRWGVFAGCGLLLLALATDPGSRLYKLKPMGAWFPIAIGMTILGGVCIVRVQTSRDSRQLLRLRNFYGVLSVAEHDDPRDSYRKLEHGRVIHGLQFLDAARAAQPQSYYASGSGLNRAMQSRMQMRQGLRVGVVGLGAGSIAALARRGDTVCFYEIDPDVLRLAQQYFTYLRDCRGTVRVVMGDARMSLERESPQGFDVIVLDAFSGDSVPAHLLTREAFVVYFRHLKVDGVIAVNVTNKYLDLQPLMARVAEEFAAQGKAIVNALPEPYPVGQFSSAWVLLSRDHGFFESPAVKPAAAPLIARKKIGIWTDDRTNLFQILRR